MVPKTAVKADLFQSGFCTAHNRIVNPTHGSGIRKFYAVWALIEHLELGYILFDTGYTKRFFDATHKLPDRIYRWATPVKIEMFETAKEVLAKRGITPSMVKYVIVSHFHADHIGGLMDFPSATIICTKAAYTQFINATRWNGVFKGLLKQLAPGDLDNRLQFIEDISSQYEDKNGLVYFDLFEKQKLRLIALPGHARGMLGMFMTINDTITLFATDAAWDNNAFENNILPAPIVRLFFDSWGAYKTTWKKLHLFKKYNEAIPILFTHCPETLKHIVNV